MPLPIKQTVSLNFTKGIDRKSDPYQIPLGKFFALKNKVFTKTGLLTKRNGFPDLTSLTDTTARTLTTFSGNLTAIGTSMNAYSAASKTWVSKGHIQPVKLETLSLIRSNTNQSQCDAAVSTNGLVCTVFTDDVPGGTLYKYAVADVTTGQNIVAPTAIPVSSGAIAGSPRVFFLGNYFVIVFTNLITATNHLQYVAIPTSNPSSISTNTDISATYTPNSRVAFDGVVANGNLFLAYNGSDGGGAIRMNRLSASLALTSAKIFAGRVCTMMSVSADETNSTPVIYASFYDGGGSTAYTLAVDQNLNTVLAPTQFLSTGTILNVASAAQNGVVTIFYEVSTTYSFSPNAQTNLIAKKTVTQAGVVSSETIILRSVGLASKAFISDGSIYVMSVYSSSFQPTYFLIDSTGVTIAKLAYSNGGGYLAKGLPSVSISGTEASIAYLVKDFLQALSKTQTASVGGVYTQTGVNLATFDITSENVLTSEIGNNLHITGGFLWMYDGYLPVEHGFHLWPDNMTVTTSNAGGSIAADTYSYVATYEWTDNQGNLHRSAPSVPVSVTTTGATSTNTINVPYLRITAKTSNPVKLVVYRYAVAQPIYYQISSVSSPTLNLTTSDSIAITDTATNASISGNNILYTTGGVIENIAAPATPSTALYNSRLFLIDAEDRNLLWFSKQVIEGTPVEMSDLFTKFIPPTTGAQGDTGPLTALSALDDKLVLFKSSAIYYMTGKGPDNTGANNDFSEPVFITSTVGCSNQASIVMTPQGLMFQSDKGIWLLGRDLSTLYIGADVEDYNSFQVLSALSVPETNQVRFTLDNGVTLVFDYFYGQWGTFEGIPGVSSTLYQGLHTYINSSGLVFQEAPNTYLDGSNPVLISFTTNWINAAGLLGYQRAYFLYLLGTYLSPHKLTVQIAYDYNPSPVESHVITPSDNFSENYGGYPFYGSDPTFGGQSNLEKWRVFFKRQKCEAFQITVTESFDSSYGTIPGAGLTLSGINLVIGAKSSYPRLKAARTV